MERIEGLKYDLSENEISKFNLINKTLEKTVDGTK